MTGHDQAIAGGRKHATLLTFFTYPLTKYSSNNSSHESQQYHLVNEHNVLHAIWSKM